MSHLPAIASFIPTSLQSINPFSAAVPLWKRVGLIAIPLLIVAGTLFCLSRSSRKSAAEIPLRFDYDRYRAYSSEGRDMTVFDRVTREITYGMKPLAFNCKFQPKDSNILFYHQLWLKQMNEIRSTYATSYVIASLAIDELCSFPKEERSTLLKSPDYYFETAIKAVLLYYLADRSQSTSTKREIRNLHNLLIEQLEKTGVEMPSDWPKFVKLDP